MSGAMPLPDTPLARALQARGLILPAAPIDLSPVFTTLDVKDRYVITMTGRCGSTWLASSLRQLTACGDPQEFLSEEAVPHYGAPDGSGDLRQYLQSVISGHGTGGCFGLKIDAMRLEWAGRLIDIGASFAGGAGRWVDMRRFDLVQQAASFVRAKATGQWHATAGDAPAATTGTAPLDDAALWTEMARVVRAEHALDQLHAALATRPLRIWYEEIIVSRDSLLRRVLRHLFPDRPYPDMAGLSEGTRKMAGSGADAALVRFTENYAAEINAMQALRRNFNGQRLDRIVSRAAARMKRTARARPDDALSREVAEIRAPWVRSAYFANAEAWTGLFWDPGTPFRRAFDGLPKGTVLELASGHGRHAARSAPLVDHLILIDVIAENLQVCRDRLAGQSNVDFRLGDGTTFPDCVDGSVDSIYSFDSMVHFSPAIVSGYLADTARVLRPGGRALYHHSNFGAGDGRPWSQNPHARNVMTLDDFAARAGAAGLRVLSQEPVAWGGIADLDGLTLLERPADSR